MAIIQDNLHRLSVFLVPRCHKVAREFGSFCKRMQLATRVPEIHFGKSSAPIQKNARRIGLPIYDYVRITWFVPKLLKGE
jgi:hypothetical protein